MASFVLVVTEDKLSSADTSGRIAMLKKAQENLSISAG